MEDEPGPAPANAASDLPEWKKALVRAAEIAGGWAALCRACGLRRNYFYRVIKDFKAPTLEIAMRVSTATGGRVGAREIVPELAERVREEDLEEMHNRRRIKEAAEAA